MDSVVPHQDYWMRSYSEVRWASMMDALKLRWLYEHKLYETRHGMYLPDFFLYGANIYLEVKGPCPNQVEIEKAMDVQKLSGCPVVFAWGTMASDVYGVNGAKLSFIGEDKVVHIDSNEFAPLIEHGLGVKYFYDHLSVGTQHKYNGVKSISDILHKIIYGLIGRDEMERDRAVHHAELNSGKVKQHTVRTKSELAVSAFLKARMGAG
ncbi:PDDEXK family nuclease [Pseudomonas chlororaphis]|uniref:hypothetical protein n=1 Tax=Pseudomonas chlororaphis TaxID=587753 RepID=UPI000A820F37|nr:hypothetical protein [Pseudomonas chlororaphis]